MSQCQVLFGFVRRSGGQRKDEKGAARNREPHPVLVEQFKGQYPRRSRADRNTGVFQEDLYGNHSQGTSTM